MSENYRITEPFRLEKISEVKPRCSPPLSHAPKCHPYMSVNPSRDSNTSGQPVPVLDHPFGEGIFPDTQTKPPETISSCLVTPVIGRRASPHLAATSCQGLL